MSEVVLSPKAAADRLGISAASLRRLAAQYENVCGPLPRDKHNARRWTEEALREAVALREAQNASGSEVLAAIRGAGLKPPEGATLTNGTAPPELLEALRDLTAELRAAREEREAAKESLWGRLWRALFP